MPPHKPKKYNLISRAFLTLCALLIFYCTFGALQGEYGYLRRIQIEKEENRLLVELQQHQSERAALENRNLRLSDNYLDLELLDERARAVLGMAHVDDVLLF